MFRAAFRQLPIGRASRLLASEAARRFLDRDRLGSYSQTGEDLVINWLLQPQAPSVYVDVGCNDPVRMSNTYRLYLKGWCGLAIDANADFAKRFAAARPKDTFVTACVGNGTAEVSFNVYADPALSSITDQRFVADAERYRVARVDRMVPRPLTSVLLEHAIPDDFGLLSIDVEGHDFEALQSLDLTRFRPRVIVIEMHDADLGVLASHPISRHLASFGYAPRAFQADNGFYVQAATK